MSTKKKKWLVQVPVTIMVCAEVTAPSKNAAIVAANEMVNSLEAYYTGDGQLDRAPWVGINSNGDENQTWFDPSSFDACDIFLSDKTTAEPWTENDD